MKDFAKAFARGLLIFAFVLVVLVPIAWVVMTSFKSGDEIFSSPWAFPRQLQFSNYLEAWDQAGIGSFFVNSIVVTLFTLILLLPIGSMAAYVLAKFPFRGSKFIYGAFLGGMMFPNFLVIVPLFSLMQGLGMLDTKHGLILVYVAYSLSFTIFVMHGFFTALPKELLEAAEIDGCTENTTFWRVMFPLAKPGVIVVGIFNAIGLWNEYGLAKVLVTSKQNRTLPIGLAEVLESKTYSSDWGAMFAALVIVMIPVLIVYWIFREKIHQTMLAGAIKG